MTKASVRSVVEEIAGASLGDKRREVRLKQMMERVAQKPGASVAVAMVTPAEAQAAYQLLNQPDVEAASILRPHVERTLQRCQAHANVLFLHDTTDFSFGGQATRRGLGPLNDGGQGFRSHFCLAATLERMPLGTVAMEHVVRDGKKKPKQTTRSKREDRESLRWQRVVQASAELANQHCSPVHVMDSEADDYDVLALLRVLEQRFVVRAGRNWRRLADGGQLRDVLDTCEVQAERHVELSERAPKNRNSRSKRNQPREGRSARLVISSRSVSVMRPVSSSSELPDQLDLNVVLVREVDCPEGCEPVEWVLLTSEPVDSADAAAFVVDAYRARWTIEEFFRALKTGCGFESSQLESFDALEKWLAMQLPVAWQLLLLRSAHGQALDAPASTLLTPQQLTVMAALKDAKLAPNPTVADAVAALARLGSQIRKGRPGWIILGRGLRRVNDGVLILEALQRRDQT